MATATPTIDRLWGGFCRACFGGEHRLPEQQRVDLKRTFVGGMRSSLDIGLEPEGDDDIGLEAMVRQLHAEFHIFAELVKRGEA